MSLAMMSTKSIARCASLPVRNSVVRQAGAVRRCVVVRATGEEPSRPAAETPSTGIPDVSSKPMPGPIPATAAAPEAPGFGSLMAFSGRAPELINGRLAMLGFVAALGAELASGQSVLKQLTIEPTLIALTFILFSVASLIPLSVGDAPEKETVGPFNVKAEMTNGRLAMLGFAGLLITELVKGSALF